MCGNIATLDMKAWLWSSFLHYHTGSTFHPVRTYRKLLPTSGNLNFKQLATFITQNRCIYTTRRCAEKSFYTTRCSDRFWDGVWSDMTIECVLMCATRFLEGSHADTELQRTLAKWLCALPVEEFNGNQAEFSKLYHTLILRLGAHLPLYVHYGGDPVSLSPGITGDSLMNCHNAGEAGQRFQHQMVGKSFPAAKMTRKVKTLASETSSIVVHGYERTLNRKPNRMICFLEGSANLSSVILPPQ